MTTMPEHFHEATQAAFASIHQHDYRAPLIHSYFELPGAWVLLLEVMTPSETRFKYGVVWDKKRRGIVEDEVPEYEFWQRKGDLQKYAPQRPDPNIESIERMTAALKLGAEALKELEASAKKANFTLDEFISILYLAKDRPDVQSKLAALRIGSQRPEAVAPRPPEILQPPEAPMKPLRFPPGHRIRKKRVGAHTPKKERNR